MTTTAEAVLIDHLSTHQEIVSAGVLVAAQVPPERPERFVTVERVGGAIGRFTQRPIFAVQAWGPSRLAAALLADQVSRILLHAALRPEVGAIAVTHLYHHPDPDSGQERYQLTVETTLAHLNE